MDLIERYDIISSDYIAQLFSQKTYIYFDHSFWNNYIQPFKDLDIATRTQSQHIDHLYSLVPIIFGTTNLKPLIQQINSNCGGKALCAQLLTMKDIVWRCKTCQAHASTVSVSIFCQPCFEKGNHEGHQVYLQKGSDNGVCDCGDHDGFLESGFCPDHKGSRIKYEDIVSKFPTYIQEAAPIVLGNLCQEWKQYNLNIFERIKMLKSENTTIHSSDTAIMDIKKSFSIKTMEIIQTLKSILQLAPAMVHFIGKALMTRDNISNPSLQYHQCCGQFNSSSQQIINQSDQQSDCQCSALDTIYQTNHYLIPEVEKAVKDFFISMFQSYEFKTQMCLSSILNYQSICYRKIKEGIIELGAQGYISPDIANIILQNDCLSNQFTLALKNLISRQWKASKVDKRQYRNFYQIMYNLSSLREHDRLTYVYKHTDQLKQICDALTDLYFIDAIDQKDNQIDKQINFYNQILIQQEYCIPYFMQDLFTNIDYADNELNSRTLSDLQEIFMKIEAKRSTNNQDKSYFNIPIHRLFAIYLTRLIGTQIKLQKIDNLSDIHNIIGSLLGMANEEYNQLQFGSSIYQCPLKVYSFINEVIAKKWVYHGQEMLEFHDIYFYQSERFFNRDIGLLQILIATNQCPEQLVNKYIQDYAIDSWLPTLLNQLKSNKINYEILQNLPNHFDIKKLNLILLDFFKFFIQLAINTNSYLQEMCTPQEKLHYEYEPKISDYTLQLTQEISRQMIQKLIKNKGICYYNDIKQGLNKEWIDTEPFNAALDALTINSQDAKGKTVFKINMKAKELHYYDPFLCVNSAEQHMYTEGFNELFKGKEQMYGINNFIGDYQNNYKYEGLFLINQKVQVGLVGSQLMEYIAPIINLATQNEDAVLIDDEMIASAIKLIFIFLNGLSYNINEQFSVTKFVSYFVHDDYRLMKSMQKLYQNRKEKGFNYQFQIIENLICKICRLAPDKFSQFQELSEDINQNEQKQQSNKQQVEAKANSIEKQKLIFQKFNEKRNKFIENNTASQAIFQKLNTLQTDKQIIVQQCASCREDLQEETYNQNPYGQICLIGKSKVLFHALNQTIQHQNQLATKLTDQQNQIAQQDSQSNIIDEEIKEQIITIEKQQSSPSKYEFNDNNVFNIYMREQSVKYVDEYHGNGIIFQACGHFIHIKCLASYIIQENQTKFQQRQIAGFEQGSFNCPLCKAYSNFILPIEPDNLQIKDLSDIAKDISLITGDKMLYQSISKFIQCKKLLAEETQKKDIIQLDLMCYSIIHQIQLISLKGIDWLFKQQDAIQVIHKFLIRRIELQGEENLAPFLNKWLPHSLKRMLDGEGIMYFNEDLGTLTLLCLILVSKLPTNNGKQELIKLCIKFFYTYFKYAVLIKCKFLQNNQKLTISNKEDKNLNPFTIQSLQSIEQDASLQDAIIQASIQYLRKVISLMLLINMKIPYGEESNQDIQNKLIAFNDEKEEYIYILSKLVGDNIAASSDSLIVNENEILQEVVVILQKGIELEQISKQLDQFYEYHCLHQLKESVDQYIQPHNRLKLLCPQYTFSLIQLPDTLKQLIHFYYRQVCDYCEVQTNQRALCLLCGKVFCMGGHCHEAMQLFDPEEGTLSYNSRMDEGTQSIFINIFNGEIYLIDEGRVTVRPSPYRNKYGETYVQDEKTKYKLDEYCLGGVNKDYKLYSDLARMFLNFQVPSEVMKDRSGSQRTIRIHAL